MNHENIILTERIESQRPQIHDSIYMNHVEQAKSRLVVAKEGWGWLSKTAGSRWMLNDLYNRVFGGRKKMI